MSGNPASGKKDIPLRGFKVTISTKFDVSDVTIKKFVNWVKKGTVMHHIVSEHGSSGTKHLHALLCYERPRVKADIQEYVWKHHVRDHNEGANVGKYAVRVDVLYDDKWHSEYLSKEVTHEVISSEYDATAESEYYPAPGVKEELEGIAAHYARSDFWGDLATKFKEWYAERHHNIIPNMYAITSVHEFYFSLMFVERTVAIVSDDRRRRQNVYCLWLLVNQITAPSYEDRKYYHSHHGNVVDFRE
jgi:hypothetical protein